ncbi:6349_t:CDS:2 [Funneliformis geosporum]|uniref:18065_t:CDS:1 n=1 Tax=Funneliformis geosporum TaxID=1117311 RepID=A0A9W4SDA7_9GLOM|nr:18065_t:CDS:2 [Funneliformis geosporum]CAI2166532.1 6349_t:CDS:2 [Funneliformis geosporum]
MDDEKVGIKKMISRQIRNHPFSLYGRQLFERIRRPYQRIIRKNLYDLIEDLNNSTNLKILKSMVEDPSVHLSENDLYTLLEELTFIQEFGEYTQDYLEKLENRIKTITSVLELIVFNIETIRLDADFYEQISDQLKNCVSRYRNYPSVTSWATSLNHYIPKEETIHKYNFEFLLEYIFDLLKVLQKNELQFRKVNLRVDHFLKDLVGSLGNLGFDGCIGKNIPSSSLPLEQRWERLRNTCDFGHLVSPFFTNYYLLKKIKMSIQTWSYEGNKIMISKYGKRLLLEFMWMHADNVWFEEMKCDRKMNSSNDEILTQGQLKNIVFLFGILDLMQSYMIESEDLSTLALVYFFVKESLQKTTSAPIQIKSTVILLQLYFRDGNFFKIIEQDFESYLLDLCKESTEAMTCFKTFLLAIKLKLCQEISLNDILFENLRDTNFLSQIQNGGKISNMNKNMVDIIADEMMCSVTLEPGENLCILGCKHIISHETFLNILRTSKYTCPQCRQDILVSTPPILMSRATRGNYFSTPLLNFDSATISSPTVFNFEEGLPNHKSNIHNEPCRIWWPLKMAKKLHPAYNEAVKALNNKRYEESVLWLTCLLKHYPSSYSTRCDRAFINSLLLGQHFRALGDLNIALCIKTKSPHAWYLRGEIIRRIGHYEDALVDINRSLHLSSENAISYGIRGAILYKLKRFNEALEDLNCSLQKLPNNGYCLSFRGATLMKIGLKNEALADFNKALEINSGDVFVLVKRARLHHTLYLDDLALIDINNALSINPCNYKALLTRGEIYAAMKRDSEALLDINKSLGINPNNINGLKILAKIYHKMNRNEEALENLDKVLNLKSDDVSILELRGEIYRSMCCFEKAVDVFNRILQLDSNNLFALSYRGATKYDQELYEEALIDVNKALELRGENNSFILKTRARILIALERYHEALMDQNEILENDPDNSVILLERREVYHKLGICDKARSNSTNRCRKTLKPTYSC